MTISVRVLGLLFTLPLGFSGAIAADQNNDPPPLVRTVTPPPQIRAVATPRPPTKITLSPDGKAILVSGMIEPGAAYRFEVILDAVPSIEKVSLMSQGGSIDEATKIYQSIKVRGLETYVDQYCMSACTMLFLGGRQRSATPQAKIGFHQPYFIADKSLPNAAIVASMRRFYDEANVRPSFTDKSMKTPSNGMWYPSFDELLAANVVTNRVLGGQTSTLANTYKSRTDWENALQKQPTYGLIKIKHPDIFDQLVDAAWTAQQEGKIDNEVFNAFRAKLTENLSTILSAADDAVFDRYLRLALAQAKAARDVSFDACHLYSQGKLNIQQNLPEYFWKEAALQSNGTKVIVTEKEVEDLWIVALADMTETEIEAIAAPPKSNPIDLCNATIKMFSAIEKMPTAERIRMARYLYTST